MTDHWDTMIEKDDAELVAEISADKAAYTFHMCAGNVSACIDIEKKYGLYGLSPQQVTQQLHEMSQPMGGEV
jgi:hypothetical protein